MSNMKLLPKLEAGSGKSFVESSPGVVRRGRLWNVRLNCGFGIVLSLTLLELLSCDVIWVVITLSRTVPPNY